MHQIANAIQIQHNAGAARAAASQQERARVFEAKGNQIADDLSHDLRPHEREHVLRRGPGAAPAVARAVRNEAADDKDSNRYKKLWLLRGVPTRGPSRRTIPTRDSRSTRTGSLRDLPRAIRPLKQNCQFWIVVLISDIGDSFHAFTFNLKSYVDIYLYKYQKTKLRNVGDYQQPDDYSKESRRRNLRSVNR